jgi:copper chaperone
MSIEQAAYIVNGMTCGHCVSSVTDEVGAVPGVTSVDVDLQSKKVVVAGTALDDTALRAAIEEAGCAADVSVTS